jgi:predicted nucleic acid-binding Zn ribbon protein
MDAKDETLTSLRDILTNLMSDAKLSFNPNDALIWKVWDEVVGPAIAKHAQPTWIKDGRLRVKVTDPIWLQELGFVGDAIKEKINKKLGRKAVERIEFRLGTGQNP